MEASAQASGADVESEPSNNSRSTPGEFDPVAHGLDADFRVTKFAEFRGWGCKIPQDTLQKLLKGLDKDSEDASDASEVQSTHPATPRIGMNVSVTPLSRKGLLLVQTTDFFYAVCDDPYTVGRITCASVLSDLYAMGVTECDNMLMLLGVSNKMTPKERDLVIPLIIKGFKNCALEAGTIISGGQTVLNPWLTIGGVATAVCPASEFLEPNNAVVGDVLILTKPLGTQIAITAYQLLDQPERWNELETVISKEEVKKAYRRAIDCMSRLNKIASLLMHLHNAHGATDITKYGLIAHAQNLAKIQKNEVSFRFFNIPVIAKMAVVSKHIGNMYSQLLKGRSVETSGGLLICIPREQAESYYKAVEEHDEFKSWIVGIVEHGNRTATIIDKPRVIEVPARERYDQLW